MSIVIENMMGTVPRGLFNQTWIVKKSVDDMQLYRVSTPISSEYGVMIDTTHIRMPENQIGIILPHTNKEAICYECGGDRLLEIKIDLDFIKDSEWHDWCYFPKFKRKENDK